jgi:hypothetical protein
VRAVRFAFGVALLSVGAFSCAEEEPWRGTADSFFDAVEAGDLEGASALCIGDPAGLAPYLEAGVRPEVVAGPEDGDGRVELAVRTPGRPGLSLVLVEKDDDGWFVEVDDSLDSTTASALNAAFGGE